MSDYKESAIVGKSYVRANRVDINNGLDAKTITFHEVTVANLSNGETRQEPFDSVSESFTAENANTEFSLINPVDGTDTKVKMTYQDLYVAIYSLYFKLALERDKFEAEQIAIADAAAATQ